MVTIPTLTVGLEGRIALSDDRIRRSAPFWSACRPLLLIAARKQVAPQGAGRGPAPHQGGSCAAVMHLLSL